MDRRDFLKAGLLSGGVLATGTTLYGCSDLKPVPSSTVISEEAILSLQALIPVFLSGMLPENAEQRARIINDVIADMELAIKKFPPHTQDELQQLFEMLNNRLVVLAFVGKFAVVAELSTSQMVTLINAWRYNFVGLLNTAYAGLKELIFAAFYGSPDNWHLINYKKPMLG